MQEPLVPEAVSGETAFSFIFFNLKFNTIPVIETQFWGIFFKLISLF